jgi:hypothetical protein
MTEPVSGCGPGIGRPPDTPMHGTRNVLIPPDPHELRLLVLDAATVCCRSVLGKTGYMELARKLQRASDIATLLGGNPIRGAHDR